MKIGILTWYKATNHGAVLQAYCLQRFLEVLGHDAILLDYQRVTTCPDSKLLWRSRFAKLFSGYYIKGKEIAKFDLEKGKAFEEFIGNELKIGGLCTEEECDAIIVGSDMVFSLIQGWNSYMYGYGLKTNIIFSYAASAGGATKRLAIKMGVEELIRKGIGTFNGLGCRDEETKLFIKDITGRNDLVDNIDPVLLYGFSKEKIEWDIGKWENHEPYLLLYSYSENMNDIVTKNTIRIFSRRHGLKIISCGYYHSWCDESVNAGPKEFLEMFKYAKCVVTDTFHGTVFSLIYQKRFASLVKGNGFKLKYLLQQCGMIDRLAVNSYYIERILGTKCDYSRFDVWINDQRKKSLRFITEQLS